MKLISSSMAPPLLAKLIVSIENISVIGISPSIAITPLAIYILFRVLFEEIISKIEI